MDRPRTVPGIVRAGKKPSVEPEIQNKGDFLLKFTQRKTFY